MKKYHLLLIGSVLILVGAGCAASTPTAPTAGQPPAVKAPALAPTPAPAPAPKPAPTPAPTPAPAPAPSAKTSINITGFSFQPARLTVKAGATVVWINQDPVPHTVTADDGSFDSGTLATVASTSHTFNKPGTYAYHCTFHPSMHGTIVVQ